MTKQKGKMIPYRVALTKTDMVPIDLHPVEEDKADREWMALRESYAINSAWNDEDVEIINVIVMASGPDEALKRGLEIRTELINTRRWKPTEYGEIKWNDDEKDFEPDQL